jgi:hypothetical protein
MPVESDIKQQYAKFFTEADWQVFKLMSDFYLRRAAVLKTKDIDCDEVYRLLLRNVQKRLFIGIGCELLLKAFFLRNGYCINSPKRGLAQPGNPPYEIRNIERKNFDIDDTLTFNKLIEQIPCVPSFANCKATDQGQVLKGLKTAKVFRNKEGHVATLWHNFDPANYSDIETSLILLYEVAFSEKLVIQFAVARNEKSSFSIVPI